MVVDRSSLYISLFTFTFIGELFTQANGFCDVKSEAAASDLTSLLLVGIYFSITQIVHVFCSTMSITVIIQKIL